MKAIFIFIISSLILQCQTPKKMKAIPTDFVLTEHSVLYKNQELPFGKPIGNWVKLFGKYDRVYNTSIYVWDDLGICAKVYWGEKAFTTSITNQQIEKRALNEPISELHIFFMNLDSPLGQSGKLTHALGRKSINFVKSEHEEGGSVMNDDYYAFLENDERAKKHYIYPYHIYSDTVNVDGAMISAGMNVADINQQRKALGIDPIRYFDADMNYKAEHGSLTTTSNGYFSHLLGFDNNDNKEEEDFYNILYRQTEGELEYIRIVHDTGQEYFKY